MKYFAYGSNILRSRLENQGKNGKRIGIIKDEGIGKILACTVKFNKQSNDGSGKANIVDEKNEEVLGVIYDLTEEQLNLLDKIEVGYKRCPVEVVVGNDTIRMKTYIALPEKVNDELLPTKDYLDFLIQGAEEHDFPEDYKNKFKELMQRLS